MTDEPLWRIVSLTETDDEGERLFWSNDEGWTLAFEADVFDAAELLAFDLPIDGAWVRA